MRRLQRPAPARSADPIVPMVDVAFVLLVFALLAGRMDATAPFEVSPPISAAGSDLPQGGVTVSVSVDGRLALDGAEIAREGAAAAVAAAALSAEGGSLPVRLNVHAAAPVGAFLPLAAALEEAGVADVALVVTPGAR